MNVIFHCAAPLDERALRLMNAVAAKARQRGNLALVDTDLINALQQHGVHADYPEAQGGAA